MLILLTSKMENNHYIAKMFNISMQSLISAHYTSKYLPLIITSEALLY